MTDVLINTEWIKLDSFLKLAGVVQTGGAAKSLVQDGYAKVNGEECRQRGKKLFSGDVIFFEGCEYKVVRK